MAPIPSLAAIESIEAFLRQVEEGTISVDGNFIVSIKHGEDGERLVLKFGKEFVRAHVVTDREHPEKSFAEITLRLDVSEHWEFKAAKVKPDGSLTHIILAQLDN